MKGVVQTLCSAFGFKVLSLFSPCVCVCGWCVCTYACSLFHINTHTHIYIHTYIYIYIRHIYIPRLSLSLSLALSLSLSLSLFSFSLSLSLSLSLRSAAQVVIHVLKRSRMLCQVCCLRRVDQELVLRKRAEASLLVSTLGRCGSGGSNHLRGYLDNK